MNNLKIKEAVEPFEIIHSPFSEGKIIDAIISQFRDKPLEKGQSWSLITANWFSA